MFTVKAGRMSKLIFSRSLASKRRMSGTVEVGFIAPVLWDGFDTNNRTGDRFWPAGEVHIGFGGISAFIIFGTKGIERVWARLGLGSKSTARACHKRFFCCFMPDIGYFRVPINCRKSGNCVIVGHKFTRDKVLAILLCIFPFIKKKLNPFAHFPTTFYNAVIQR